MAITFNNIYEKASGIFNNHTLNLRGLDWCDPWVIGLVCLKAIEYKDKSDKQFIPPAKEDEILYLKRMHFDKFLEKLTYGAFLQEFRQKEIHERDNLNVHEIMHCEFRDDFGARLSSRIRMMFQNFGMNQDDESRATALVGELGNNVFDHNEGSWPTDMKGAIILAQHYPKMKQIEVVVADPGIGFRGSLRVVNPGLTSDLEAIKLGLSGVTGRMGEPRGNGLRVIQDWTINKFDGIVKIHSGNGLVVVNKDGQYSKVVFSCRGDTGFICGKI